MRLLTQDEANANLSTCFALALHQTGGSTSMTVAVLQRFADAGALIMPVLVEDVAAGEDLPDWVPLPLHGTPFIPRGFAICLVLDKASYDAACTGATWDALRPWDGTGDAYVLFNNVISMVRNGVARMVVALAERAAAHKAFPVMREMMWYTLTAKGVALSDYFGGQDTGRMLTRTFANGQSKAMPIYTLAVADWRAHTDAIIEKLIGIEANFSDTLAEVHKKMKEGL